MAFRALTKKDQSGQVYVRPDAIQKAIDIALEQNLSTLCDRAWVTTSSAPNYLPPECIVHIIRNAGRSGEEHAMNALLPPLLSRCEAILKRAIPDSRKRSAEEIRENVLSDFSELFALDGGGDNPDELDFYECRFFRAFRAFYIDRIRISTRLQSDRFISLSPQPESRIPDGNNDKQMPLSEALKVPASQLDDLLYKDLMKAIERLPADECAAVTLCYVYGLKEESEDPSVPTAAKLCGVTGRTIRNRLERAKAKLSQFREDL